jgi:hypothetical protein
LYDPEYRRVLSEHLSTGTYTLSGGSVVADEKLEERLKGKIDAQYKDEISFETERETFTS